jgi:hypothetical protein
MIETRSRRERRSRRGGRSTRHPVERYKEEFPEGAGAFLSFLDRCRLEGPRSSDGVVGVVVTPWVSTPAPWMCLALAVGMVQRGKNVELIWDDSGLGLPLETPERLREQEAHIGIVLQKLRRDFPIVRLSEQPARPPQPGDVDALGELSRLNLTWGLRGANPSDRDRLLFPLTPEKLAGALANVRGLLQNREYESLLLIGGLYGTSGLFYMVARENGIRASTFDGTFGVVQVCVDGIAAQQSDIAFAFREFEQAAPEVLDWARQQAKDAFRKRAEARDEAAYQVVPSDQREVGSSSGVVIPMNVEWDGAALGLHDHFADTADWITSTVEYVLTHSEENVVVRQHPAERNKYERSRFDIGAMLEERFGSHPRLRLVMAEDPINTYDLIRSATVVLPFVSTIGIEAAAMEKVVLVSGASFYADLDFVWRASSRQEYFTMLESSLVGELPLKPRQAERAWLCYYLTPVCNRVWTDFTLAPSESDFWSWVTRDPNDLFNDASVADILTALARNRPLSLIRHERKLRHELAPTLDHMEST